MGGWIQRVMQAHAPYRLEEDFSQNSGVGGHQATGTRLRLKCRVAGDRQGDREGGQKLCPMGVDGVNAARSGPGWAPLPGPPQV